MPPSFVTSVKREPYSSIFGFQEDMTLVFYVPKKGKAVVLLSSVHSDDKIDESTGEHKKPEIITFYNSTKSGVDCVDEHMAFYVARNTRRWTMVIFYALLNIAGFNSFLIFRENNPDSPESKNKRNFLKRLVFTLTKEQIIERCVSRYFPKHIRDTAKRLTGMNEEVQPENVLNKRGRCGLL